MIPTEIAALREKAETLTPEQLVQYRLQVTRAENYKRDTISVDLVCMRRLLDAAARGLQHDCLVAALRKHGRHSAYSTRRRLMADPLDTKALRAREPNVVGCWGAADLFSFARAERDALLDAAEEVVRLRSALRELELAVWAHHGPCKEPWPERLANAHRDAVALLR